MFVWVSVGKYKCLFVLVLVYINVRLGQCLGQCWKASLFVWVSVGKHHCLFGSVLVSINVCLGQCY